MGKTNLGSDGNFEVWAFKGFFFGQAKQSLHYNAFYMPIPGSKIGKTRYSLKMRLFIPKGVHNLKIGIAPGRADIHYFCSSSE